MQQIFFKLVLFMPRLVSFRGQKMHEPRPDWSPLGANFKILDEHPHLFFIFESPLPGAQLIDETPNHVHPHVCHISSY